MVPLELPMVPLVPTFLPMVILAPMVPLAAEKRSGFSCYQWYHWLPMVPLVKFPMVPLGEFRTHAIPLSPLDLPMVPLVPTVPSIEHWLPKNVRVLLLSLVPMVTNGSMVNLPTVPLGEPRTEPGSFVVDISEHASGFYHTGGQKHNPPFV